MCFIKGGVSLTLINQFRKLWDCLIPKSLPKFFFVVIFWFNIKKQREMWHISHYFPIIFVSLGVFSSFVSLSLCFLCSFYFFFIFFISFFSETHFHSLFLSFLSFFLLHGYNTNKHYQYCPSILKRNIQMIISIHTIIEKKTTIRQVHIYIYISTSSLKP